MQNWWAVSTFYNVRKRPTIISIYRVSHETWQLVNSFECLLPYAVLDIKIFLQFILLKIFLLKYILLINQFYYNMGTMKYLLLFSLATNNLTYYGRRHFKLFQQLSCFVGHPLPPIQPSLYNKVRYSGWALI